MKWTSTNGRGRGLTKVDISGDVASWVKNARILWKSLMDGPYQHGAGCQSY